MKISIMNKQNGTHVIRMNIDGNLDLSLTLDIDEIEDLECQLTTALHQLAFYRRSVKEAE